MANIKIQAQSRTETKKMKSLIDEDYIPGVLYDQNGNSENIKIPSNIVTRLLTNSREMPLVGLKVDDGAENLALLKEVQINPRKNIPSHLSFLKLDPKKKALFTVDISLIGESPAIKNSLGILLVTKTSLELRGLPEDVPSHIEIDISSLKDVGDVISVNDLSIPENLTLINEETKELPVASIQPFQKTIEDEKPETEGEVDDELEEGADGEAETTEDGEAVEAEAEDETANGDQDEDRDKGKSSDKPAKRKPREER